MDIAGFPIKKHSLGACEPESPMIRKPFSPISSTASSKSNIINLLEDLNSHGETTTQKAAPPIESFTTPSKTSVFVDEENRTPKAMPIPVPSTPSTVSVPMQTAITPAHASAPPTPYGTTQVEETVEEIEYSFEERRAGFVLLKTHVKPLIQV